MLSEMEKKDIEQGFVKIFIIWGALFFSLIIYIGIAIFVGEEIRKGMMNQIPIYLFRNILLCVSAFEIIIIGFLRKTILPKKNLANPESRQTGLGQSPPISQYMTATIISSAIAESIGIYGLILYFLGASIGNLYLFMVISAAVMIFYRPKKEELLNILTDLNQSD
jgi:hypothetical protein